LTTHNIIEKSNQSITLTVEEVDPTKEVCLQTISTSLLSNIEKHDLEIPVWLSF